MIRLLRLRHAAAGYRLGAVRAQHGAARVLEHQAGRGPSKLPPSWGLATAQVTRAAHDLVRTRGGPSIKSAEVQTGTSQDIAQYGAALQRLASVESKTLGRQELKDMVHSPALAAFQATHVTAWLERYTALDAELLCPPKDDVRVLSAEGLLVMGRGVEILDGQRVTTSATRSANKGAVKQPAGVEGFSPSLASRLLYALGHGGYTWRGKSLEELDRLVSLLLPVAVGEGGEGLRRLTAQELGRLPRGLALLYPSRGRRGAVPEPKFSEEMVHVEAECLRRGLDKFKAADLADLLQGLEGLCHDVNSAFADVVQERMMRRGYLTKGRGGHTDPRDAVRLLEAFSMTGPIREMSDRSSLSTFISHVLASKGLLESLQPRDLLYVLDVARRFNCHDIHREALERLIAREEEWAGRDGVDHRTVDCVFGSVNTALAGTLPQGAEDLLGRLVVRWAAEVEAGECVLYEPYYYFQRLLKCNKKGLLRGEGKEHAAQVLMRGLADRLRLGSELWLTKPGQIMEVLHIFHKLSYYPGQDIIDGLIDRFHAVASTIGFVNRSDLCKMTNELFRAAEQHGYTPPPGFASMVLEWCKNMRLTNDWDVSGLAVVVERLYGSFLAKAPPEAYPSQAAVDALLQHIGDPDKLVERVCPRAAPYPLLKLKAAVDLLKRNKAMTTPTPPQGGDRGAEDGRKKAEQLEGETTDGGAQARLAKAVGKESAQKGGGIEGITTIKQDLWGESEGTTVGQDRAVEVLWGLIQRAHDNVPGKPAVHLSDAVRGFSTLELESLIQGLASRDTVMEKGVGTRGTYSVVREAMRPERLEGLRSQALLPLALCLGHMASLRMLPSERKALLDAWVGEVRMRGLAQVINGPQDLASLISALGRVGVEVEEALMVSLLAEVQSLGLQNYSPKQLEMIFDGLSRTPRSAVLYGEELQALQTQMLPQANLNTLMETMACCIERGLAPDAALLSRAEEASRAEEGQIGLDTLAHLVYLFDTLEYTPGEATLRAVEQALLRDLSTGVAEQEPQDEKAREAMKETALRQLGPSQVLSIMRVFLKSHYRCDPRLWDPLALACLSKSIEPPVRMQRVAEFRGVLADHLGTPAVGQDPLVPVLQWLWNAVGNQHFWDVRPGYLHALVTKSWELDTFPRPGVVRELLGHWVAAVEGAEGEKQEHGRVVRDNLFRTFTADLPKLVSRHGLSGSQVLEMVDPLRAHLETLCAGKSGTQLERINHVDLLTIVQVLGCLELLSVVPGRRSIMEFLWAQGLAVGFQSFSVPSILALVRGLAAHDMHPGAEAVTRLGAHCRWGVDSKHFVEQVTDMQEAIAQGRQVAWGLEGGGGGAEGERFLRDLLEHHRRSNPSMYTRRTGAHR